jgi:hypothetical protein
MARRALGSTDSSATIRVNIHLNNRLKAAEVQAQLRAWKVVILAERLAYKQGVISAELKPMQLERVAKLPGVRSVLLAPKPFTRVGKVTSQAAVVHRTDELNAQGFSGSGISIGVLSDSFNGSNSPFVTPAEDIASGDLPGPGNPEGNTTPIVVLEDFYDSFNTIDEGRAMMQLIHDLAPKAKLSYATAFVSDVGFANNIIALHTNPQTLCDVIVDDVGYINEPMFSDGVIAQAIDQVTTVPNSAGRTASFFSAAGNSGSSGYDSEFRYVADSTARARGGHGNLKLNQVPKRLTDGGFHNFRSDGGGIAIAQQFGRSGSSDFSTLIFQWNDPFDSGAVTTDYNVLIFRPDGRFLKAFSSLDDNFLTDQPLELAVAIPGFQIAISRSLRGRTSDAPVARRLRYVSDVSPATYTTPNVPTIFGHPGARGANAVGAYIYHRAAEDSTTPFLPQLEDFSSFGPFLNYFDRKACACLHPRCERNRSFPRWTGPIPHSSQIRFQTWKKTASPTSSVRALQHRMRRPLPLCSSRQRAGQGRSPMRKCEQRSRTPHLRGTWIRS